MNRADLAVRGYECPVAWCAKPPGLRCVSPRGRLNMHPHRKRVALVARPARGPSDHAIASWVRSRADDLRAALTYVVDAEEQAGLVGNPGAKEPAAMLAELERLIPQEAAGPEEARQT